MKKISKVVLFSNSDGEEFQKDVNEFINDIKNEIIEIQFSTCSGLGNAVKFCALIICSGL